MKLPSVYEPGHYEANIYALWEQGGVFQPHNRGGEGYFSTVLPPPNANGDLHLGHALTVAIEDTLVRYHRMQGKPTLYVPGSDHAGFETWVVYERQLQEQGKSRFDYTRQELYDQVWDFVQQNKENFERQLRALGISADWSRYTFTLDQKVVDAAYGTFQKMWDEGLIYRGKRVVNFCTFHGTSFSDIEVEHVEEKTKLWHIAYPLADGSGEVVIATTRPETKLGQAALMVNPKDERYKHLIGKIVHQPLVPEVPIQIIGDDYVDPAFGTGVVTVTPGHDINDFEVAQRHNLPVLELITHEGKMSENVPEQFRGMGVLEAREAVAKAIDKKGLMRKIEPYTHTVGVCYKCKNVIEPLLREQWFVKMQPLAKLSIASLKEGRVALYPKSKLKETIRYLEGIRDWNISRQIAWGIPIPAYRNIDDPEDWVFSADVNEEYLNREGKTYHRDPDVFDTWFSSGHWPLVTLNYPDSEDFRKFYPLSLMETGYDILNQWVTRMLGLGLYLTGEPPFKNVYLHGLIQDETGQKMSKSKGNVLNPMEIVEQFGSDALRLGILAGRTAGLNSSFDRTKFEGGRNFCNKLWNIARYVEGKLADQKIGEAKPEPHSIADHWILSKLQHTTDQISHSLDNYRLNEAYESLYRFVWDDLADWYIEASKIDLNLPLLKLVTEETLKLAHPFAPFVTETIWQTLAADQENILAIQTWQHLPKAHIGEAREFEELKTIISESRHILRNLKPSFKPNLYYSGADFIGKNTALVAALGKLGEVRELKEGQGLRLTRSPHAVWLDIDRQTAESYIAELQQQKLGCRLVIRRLEHRLNNQDYLHKAPKEMVHQSKQQLEEQLQILHNLDNEIAQFSQAAAPATESES